MLVALEDVDFALSVVVVVGFEVGVELEAFEVEDVVVAMTQLLSLHVKPFGQHCVPHVASVPVRSVLCSWLAGELVAFCFDISQLKGAIVLQSCPKGQQIADLLLLKAMHCWADGQQKFAGRPAMLHGE